MAVSPGSFWGHPHGTQTTLDHMRLDWHANVVRLPLNEGCWLGVSGKAGFKGQDYINVMSTFVNLATLSGNARRSRPALPGRQEER